jgi:hypothetical protein
VLRWGHGGRGRPPQLGKDAIVSVSATLMSIVGAMSTIMMEVPAASNTYFGATDARMHARYIMALASFTNCISAVLMGPIYVAIATQKVMLCTLNDVSATLENFAVNARNVAGGGGRSYSKQLGLTISFGSARVESAVAESGVATCLTEDITQSVKDAVASVHGDAHVRVVGVPRARRFFRVAARDRARHPGRGADAGLGQLQAAGRGHGAVQLRALRVRRRGAVGK